MSRKGHDKLVSKIECTDHMCPVNINWHVTSKVKQNHQREIRVAVSNLNYVRNYPDWIMLVEHQALSYSTRVIHANHKFLSSSYRKYLSLSIISLIVKVALFFQNFFF